MIQSSHFTKTTPRFPFADLCIPAGQSLFIHHSQTQGGGETTDVWKIESMETMLPPKGNRKWREQLHPTAKAFKFRGFWSRLWELPKSLFKILSRDKTLKKVATPEFYLVNFVSSEKFTLLKGKRALKITFSCHKSIWINHFYQQDSRSTQELNPAAHLVRNRKPVALAPRPFFTRVSHPPP